MATFKRIASLILCVMMLLCCFPVVNAAEEGTQEIVTDIRGITPNADPTQVVCPHCDTVPSWKVWTGGSVANGDHLYLAEGGLTVSAATSLSGKTVVLNLNGQTLQKNNIGRMFLINPNSKLVILDASVDGTGVVQGSGNPEGHGGIAMVYGGDMDIYGGTYRLSEEHNSTATGGIIYAAGKEETSGNIVSKVNITGATIHGANATKGGAIAVAIARLTLKDCTIYAGTATNGGDSILTSTTAARLTIQGNTTINGGVQISKAESIAISGKPVIMKSEGGSAYSFKMNVSKTIALGVLEEGSQIGFSGSGMLAKEFATPGEAFKVASCFVSEAADKFVTSKGTKIYSVAVEDPTTVKCPHCNEVPTWTAWDGSANHATGHFYLTGHTAFNAESNSYSKSGTLVLNLNGYTVDARSKFMTLGGSATFHVFDSSANQTGAIAGYGRASSHAGIFQVNGGTAVIHSGNFYLQDDHHSAKNGGLVSVNNSGDKTASLTIKGGEFWGADAENGGVVAVTGGALTVSGGTFHTGTATAKGDTICAAGATVALTINGNPEIEGGVYVSNAKSVEISGAPVIRKTRDGSAYSLQSVIPVTFSGLKKGAHIRVTADGVFSTAFADEAAAQVAKEYIWSDDLTKGVKLEGLALTMVTSDDPEDLASHPSKDDELNILLIGNSYSFYWPDELWGLYNAAGYENVTICNVYYSGCYFERHWNWYLEGAKNYRFCVNDSTGRWTKEGYDLVSCLAYKNWDIISFQQSGRYIYGAADPMSNHRNNIEPWLGNLYDLTMQDFPYADYYWHQSWAHEIGNGVKNLEEQLYAGEVHRTIAIEVCEKYGFTRVPCTDSWELVRHDPLVYGNGLTLTYRTGNDPDTDEKEIYFDDLTHDGDIGGGQYLNACTWFEVLTGTSVVGNTFAPVYKASDGTKHELGAEKIALLQNAAHTAVAGVYGEMPPAEPVVPVVPETRTRCAYGHESHEGITCDAEMILWTEWTKTSSLPTTGSYYLTKNVTITETWKPSDLNLDLNGFNITRYVENGDSDDCNVFSVITKKSFLLTDTDETKEGILSVTWDAGTEVPAGKYGKVGKVGVDSVMKMYGGVLDGSNITHNNTTVSNGTITVENNSSGYDAKFYMYGGKIIGIQNGSDKTGSALVSRSGTTIELYGGEIVGGTCKNDAGTAVYPSTGPVVIGGNMKIVGNIYLANDLSRVTIKDQPDIQEVKISSSSTNAFDATGLTSGAKLGIYNGRSDKSVAFAVVDEDLTSCYTALNSKFVVVYDAATNTMAMAEETEPTEPTEPSEPSTEPTEPSEPSEPQAVRGDMNNDGTVSDSDAMYLLRYTLFGDTRYPLTQSGDVDGDGTVSDSDAMYLLRYTLFGDSRYPLR